MAEKEYLDLVTYLTLWKYPDGAAEKDRKAIRGKALKYEVKDGSVLYRKPNGNQNGRSRKVLRRKEVIEVLNSCHDHLLAGHLGVKRTFDKIKEDYYWPNYYESVKEFVSSCKVCQQFGSRNPPAPILMERKLVATPFGEISMDYISLPLTENGNTFVW